LLQSMNTEHLTNKIQTNMDIRNSIIRGFESYPLLDFENSEKMDELPSQFSWQSNANNFDGFSSFAKLSGMMGTKAISLLQWREFWHEIETEEELIEWNTSKAALPWWHEITLMDMQFVISRTDKTQYLDPKSIRRGVDAASLPKIAVLSNFSQ
jgi:hypothetical protein